MVDGDFDSLIEISPTDLRSFVVTVVVIIVFIIILFSIIAVPRWPSLITPAAEVALLRFAGLLGARARFELKERFLGSKDNVSDPSSSSSSSSFFSFSFLLVRTRMCHSKGSQFLLSPEIPSEHPSFPPRTLQPPASHAGPSHGTIHPYRSLTSLRS